MRLIDLRESQLTAPHKVVLIDKLEEERRIGHPIKYAVLSHRWEHEEVTLKDLATTTWTSKYGSEKLLRAIGLARDNRHEYLWLDTCCIDKDSSSDLSEAINSMYQWYSNADVCYAYLNDVYLVVGGYGQQSGTLSSSVWFSRGWTLQELIAPPEVKLYSSQWQPMGTRSSLSSIISAVTKIPIEVLNKQKPITDFSTATRMSWAAERQTQRPEDIAYCLMGLFQVNMPLIYGEGERAFTRLQEEILKYSDDYTIFAWRKEKLHDEAWHLHGLLADSPRDFKDSAGIMQYASWRSEAPIRVTNRGLGIELGKVLDHSDNEHIATLPCCFPGQEAGFLAIGVYNQANGIDQYWRIRPDTLHQSIEQGQMTNMYFRQSGVTRGPRLAPMHLVRFAYNRESSHYGFEPVAALVNRHPYNRPNPRQLGIQQANSSPREGHNSASVALESLQARRYGLLARDLRLPKWDPALEACFLFRLRHDREQPECCFVLLVGTDVNGKVGYDLAHYRSREAYMARSNALVTAAEISSDNYACIVQSELFKPFQDWVNIEYNDCFQPVQLGTSRQLRDAAFEHSTHTVDVKVLLTAKVDLGYQENTIVCIEVDYNVLPRTAQW